MIWTIVNDSFANSLRKFLAVPIHRLEFSSVTISGQCWHFCVTFNENKSEIVPIGASKGHAGDTPSSSRPNFLRFYAVFGKYWPSDRLALDSPPLPSWIAFCVNFNLPCCIGWHLMWLITMSNLLFSKLSNTEMCIRVHCQLYVLRKTLLKGETC